MLTSNLPATCGFRPGGNHGHARKARCRYQGGARHHFHADARAASAAAVWTAKTVSGGLVRSETVAHALFDRCQGQPGWQEF